MTPESLPGTTGRMVVSFIEIGNTGEGNILQEEVVYLIFDFLNTRCLWGIQVDML